MASIDAGIELDRLDLDEVSGLALRIRIAVSGVSGSGMQDVAGCLGCDIASGRYAVPGGILHRTARWIVNHAVGQLNLGTLIVAPRGHFVAMADLDDAAAAELGPLLRDAARVVEAICHPEQTYVCVWSHGRAERRHLHILVQPVTSAVVAQYGGLRSEQLQARMLKTAPPLEAAEVEPFCVEARRRFAATVRATSQP